MWFSCIAHPTISFAMAEHGQGHLTAASALASRIKVVVPKINDIIKSCKDKVAGVLQPAVDIMTGNQMHDVHLKETKVQLMLDMHKLAMAQDRLNFATAASAPLG